MEDTPQEKCNATTKYYVYNRPTKYFGEPDITISTLKCRLGKGHSCYHRALLPDGSERAFPRDFRKHPSKSDL